MVIVHRAAFRRVLLAFSLITVSGCGGGGGGGLSTDACSTLKFDPKIINGTSCAKERTPIVELLDNYTIEFDGQSITDEQFICTGFLITPDTVLTAAHCLETFPPTSVRIGGETIPIADGVVHPKYSEREVDGQTLIYTFFDVAIVKLSRPSSVATIPIAETVELKSGTHLQIFGFGESGFDPTPVLRSGEMELGTATAFHLITKPFDGTGSNTCYGDSGGPATIELDGGLAAVGITTQGTSDLCNIGDESSFQNLQNPETIAFIREHAPGTVFK